MCNSSWMYGSLNYELSFSSLWLICMYIGVPSSRKVFVPLYSKVNVRFAICACARDVLFLDIAICIKDDLGIYYNSHVGALHCTLELCSLIDICMSGVWLRIYHAIWSEYVTLEKYHGSILSSSAAVRNTAMIYHVHIYEYQRDAAKRSSANADDPHEKNYIFAATFDWNLAYSRTQH